MLDNSPLNIREKKNFDDTVLQHIIILMFDNINSYMNNNYDMFRNH